MFREEKGTRTQTFVVRISSGGVGWGLPREGVGAKKFGMSFKAQGNQLFGGISRDFCRDIPGAPEKFEKKELVFNFWSLNVGVR